MFLSSLGRADIFPPSFLPCSLKHVVLRSKQYGDFFKTFIYFNILLYFTVAFDGTGEANEIF